MDPNADRRRQGIFAAATRMPTGAKLFLILSAALLPLAVIALVATLQTNRTVDHGSRLQLAAAARESARALAVELIGDMTALRVTLNALDADSGDAPSCARAQGVFTGQVSGGAHFIV